MLVSKQKMIYRKDLQSNPDTLYLFGDNLKRHGLGGQAREMRGEPNAVGVATKRDCTMKEEDFFSDKDYGEFINIVDADLKNVFIHVSNGGKIVIPEDGLGTGLSELPKRAPQCYAYLESALSNLEKLGVARVI